MSYDDAIAQLRMIAQRVWLSPQEHKALHLAILALEKEVKTND